MRAALLGLVVLFMLGTAQLVNARVLLDDEDDSENCGRISVQGTCRNNRGCAWCTGSAKTGCVSAKAARYISDNKFGMCRGTAVPARSTSKCDAAKTERACLDIDDDTECAWCARPASGNIRALTSCVLRQAAQYLPNNARVCKYDDDDNDDDNNNNNNNNNDDDNDNDNDSDNDDDNDGDDRDD
jgi:hypothetical protein